MTLSYFFIFEKPFESKINKIHFKIKFVFFKKLSSFETQSILCINYKTTKEILLWDLFSNQLC